MSTAVIPRISPGMQIPYYEEGDHDPQIFSSEAQNMTVAVCNSILKGKVVYGTTPGFLLSERGAIWTIPRRSAGGGTDSSGGMFPFRVYNPTGSPANTFRVHGGVALVPELFPSSTTPRDIQIDSTGKYQECDGTDLVYDTSSGSQGSDVNDIVLDNWDSGAGFYTSCGIWLEVSQQIDVPGVIATQVSTQFNFLPPYCVKRVQPDTPDLLTTLIVPLAKIIPTSIDSDPLNYGDLLGSTIIQFQREQVVWPVQFGRFAGSYDSGRVCLPGECVQAADGNYWQLMTPYAKIGDNPVTSVDNWIRINQ